MTLPQAPPSEAAVIGAEDLAHLAAGIPVLTNGGRVLVVPAPDFPRNLGGCAPRSQTVPSQVRAQDGGMAEFPSDGKLDLRGALASTDEFVALVKRVAALEDRIANLEKYVHSRRR